MLDLQKKLNGVVTHQKFQCIKWGSHEVRSELDILVVLYKSVCSVTVSIGEISFSLLARLEAWEWGRGEEAGLLQPDYAVC